MSSWKRQYPTDLPGHHRAWKHSTALSLQGQLVILGGDCHSPLGLQDAELWELHWDASLPLFVKHSAKLGGQKLCPQAGATAEMLPSTQKCPLLT